jgi:hypothetical protein
VLPSRTYDVPLLLVPVADVPLPVVPVVDEPVVDPVAELPLEPLPILALASTNLSLLLLEVPLVALVPLDVVPLVPVVPVESPRCRQPVTVTVLALLLLGVCDVLLVAELCAAMLTPHASAIAATPPVHICRVM